MEAPLTSGGIVEVSLEPKRGTAAADLGEIRALTAISDQRRALHAEFAEEARPVPTSEHPANLGAHIGNGS